MNLLHLICNVLSLLSTPGKHKVGKAEAISRGGWKEIGGAQSPLQQGVNVLTRPLSGGHLGLAELSKVVMFALKVTRFYKR